MSHKKTLENKLYINWVKSGLALKYLKEGLAPFVRDKTYKQHTDFVFGSTNSCDMCDLERLLPPHASAVSKSCSKLRERCLCIGSKRCYRYQCPNNVCGKIYDQIMDLHRYQDPGWFNSDIKKWSYDAWEVAKCYINTRGYAGSKSADDIDCCGLLSIIINNMMLSAMNESLFKKCNKVRDSRNQIMHSPSLEVTDAELQTYLAEIVDILEDPEELQQDTHAKLARQKIKELQENAIVISMSDEIELRKEAMNAIKQKQADMGEKLSELIKQIKDMERNYTERTKYFEIVQQTTETALKSMQTDIEDASMYSDNIQMITEKISDLETTFSQYTDGQSKLLITVNELKSQMKSLQQGSRVRNEENNSQFEELQRNISILQGKITSQLEDDLKTVEKSQKQANEDLLYLQKKQDVQKELLTIYEHYISNLQISPFIADLDTNIDDIYVDLVLCNDLLHKRVDEGVRRTDGVETVDLYRDIFFKENKLCKSIYMLGDAGIGKTTWCMRFLQTWVRALRKVSQSNDNVLEQNLVLDEDEKCALQFDIVAFVPLRHASEDSLILEMILNQLFVEKTDLNKAFIDVLKAEPSKCLVVLDGLDEWSKPSNTKFSFRQNQNIPGRKDIQGCPVLTTSRPWKIYSVELKESDIDRAVKIEGIKDRDLMAEKMINKLNDVIQDADQKRYEDFDKNFKDFQRLNQIASLPFDGKLPLSDFMNVPLILVIMVCLWFENGKIQSSYAGNYWAMVGNLIKYAEAQKQIKPYDERKQYYEILKGCPSSVRYLILKYIPLIVKLSKFAFDSMFKFGSNEFLVFDENALRKVLSNDEIQKSVKLGFLSQSKAIGQVLSRRTRLSFLHKSLQEFFAAVHIVNGTQTGNRDAINKFANYCDSAVKLSEMENVVMFICGLDPKTASEISAFISNLEVFDIHGKEIDKMNMYITYNLPLKCAMQAHAFDMQYPSTEFPIHIKHVFVENNDQYRPILKYTYSLLKANIGRIETIAVNTGLVEGGSVGEATEGTQYLKQSPLAHGQTGKIFLQDTFLTYYQSPKQLTDCTLYGIDLSNFPDPELQKIEKSFREMRNLRILNFGKLFGFKSLHLNLSNCNILYFSLKETDHTTVKLNISDLDEVLLENGKYCKIELTANDSFTCMHLMHKKDTRLRIFSRRMTSSDVKIQFSCFLGDKLVVENCLKNKIEFECKSGCCHQSVQMNKLVFDKNRCCTLKADADMIIDDVSIHSDKGEPINIPVENIVEHAKTISVQLSELGAFLFKSSMIETLKLRLFENERKNLDIVKENVGKLDKLRSLSIQAQSVDPSHILNKDLITSMKRLCNLEIKVSKENFSRNSWKSLFSNNERKRSPQRLNLQDFENRSVEWTQDDRSETHFSCTHLISKDLKSVHGIINNPSFESERLKSIKIQAYTLDTSILGSIQKMTELKEMYIEFTEETTSSRKGMTISASKMNSFKTFTCQNVSECDIKSAVKFLMSQPLLKTIEALHTFTIEGEEINAFIFESVFGVTKVENMKFSFQKECSPETTDEKMIDYLMKVDRPSHSSFCVQIGKDHGKMMELHGNSLRCYNYSVIILTKILSFAALPARYKNCLTVLEVKGIKVESQCLLPIAQLEQLQTLKIALTQNVFHDQMLERLFSTLKRLNNLIEVEVHDSLLRCTFSAKNMSLQFVRGKNRQTTFDERFPAGNRNEISANRDRKIEIICKHLPFNEFRCVSSFAASLCVFKNSVVDSVQLKTKEVERRFTTIRSVRKLAELIDGLSKENFVNGNWL